MGENEINWKLVVTILWVLAISGLFGYAWLTCESFRNFVCWVVRYCFGHGNGGGEGGHEAAAAGDHAPQEADALLTAADESQGVQEEAVGDQVPQEGDALLAAADESQGGQEEAAADDHDGTLKSQPKGKEPVASSSSTPSKTKEVEEEEEEKDEVKEELQEEEKEEGVHEEEDNRGGGGADAAVEGSSTTRTYVYTGIHLEDERGRRVVKIIRKPVTGSGSGGGPSSS